MIKYEAGTHFGPKIRKVEVVSETERLIRFEEDGIVVGHLKVRPDRRYCDTFEEAKHFLEMYFTEQIGYHRRCLEMAKRFLGNAKGMKDPEIKKP